MKSFRELIEAWPSDGRGVVGSATSLAKDLGLHPESVRMWHYRGMIPSVYWPQLLVSAKGRGIRGVSAAKLVELRAMTASGRTQQRRPLDRKRSSARAAA